MRQPSLLLLFAFFAPMHCVGDSTVLPDAGDATTDGTPSNDAPSGDAPSDARSDGEAGSPEAGPPTPQGKFSWLRTLPAASAAGVATDSSGNTFVVGTFAGSNQDFGNGHLLTAVAAGDVFVIKLDSGGKTLWAKNFSSTGGIGSDDAGLGIAVDPSGDVYFTGNTDGASITIGNTVTAVYSGGSFAFAGKLKGTDGTPIWAEGFSASGSSFVMSCPSIAATTSTAIIGCSFVGTPFAWSSGTLANSDSATEDMGIVALDNSTRALLWSNAIGSVAADDSVGHVTIDASGDVLVGGKAGHSANNVQDTLASINVPHVGSGDNAIAVRLAASNGKQIWTKLFGGSANVLATSIASDPSSSTAAFGGQFAGQVDFGLGSVVANGTNDGFALMFDEKARTTTVAKVVGGSWSGQYSAEYVASVAYDVWGELVTVGTDQSTDTKADSKVIASPPAMGSNGLFAVKYSAAGAVLWANGIASGNAADSVVGSGIATTPSGEVRIVGAWKGTVALDGTNPIASSGTQAFVLGWTP